MSVPVLTITHPSGAVACAVTAVSVDGPQRKFGAPAMLVFTVTERFSLLGDATNAANPLQKDSMVDLYDLGATQFKGFVTEVVATQTADGEQALRVTCKDRLGKWEKTLAGIGSSLFTAECPTAQLGYSSKGEDVVTAVPLVPADGYAAGWPVFPAASTATDTPDNGTGGFGGSPWISKDSMPATTLGADIDDTSTDPIPVADWTIFACPGHAQIGTEFIAYDRAYQATPASGRTGYIGGVTRGALGSTAASHSEDDAVTPRVLKTISPRVPMALTTGGTYDPVTPGDYRPQLDGHVDFAFDPSGLSTLLGYYGVYAEDDATNGLTLASLASRLLQFPRAQGGPGLSTGQIDVSGLDFIPLPRYQCESQQSTLEVLQAAIDQNGLDPRGFGQAPIGFYYDSANDKAVVLSIRQTDTPAVTFRAATDCSETTGLENLYSAVSVRYANPDPAMLISTERMWHPAIGDQVNTDSSPDDTNVYAVLFCDQDKLFAAGWQEDSTVTHASAYLSRIMDGSGWTGWGLRFDAAETAHADEDPAGVLYAWFEDSAAIISAVLLVLDCRGYVAGGYPGLKIDIVGYDTYTPGDPPTLGNILPLAESLAFRIFGGGDYRDSSRPRRWVTIPGGPANEVPY